MMRREVQAVVESAGIMAMFHAQHCELGVRQKANETLILNLHRP